MIGSTVDRYEVLAELGRGGMGVVYKARDTLLDRPVALKVLPPGAAADPDRRQRFLHEARAASALNHPGIVSVYDVVRHDGSDVLVMELVDGETLERLLARRRLPLAEALRIAAAIAAAVARAHAAGIVHRDLKPSNVMVTSDGVKVLDFGLAKLTEATLLDPEAPTAAPEELALTRERMIMGTAGWMSPEQASGEVVDARSDVFSFGVVLYEMLTGRHPFRRGSTAETLSAIRELEPERPSGLEPSLPTEAERAVLRCLRKDPARRWQSLSDLAAVLEDIREDTESGRRAVGGSAAVRRRPRAALLAAGAIVLLAVAAGLVALLEDGGGHRTSLLALDRLTFDAGASVLPAISPDGNLIAFLSDRGGPGLNIWLRHTHQPEAVRLTDHPGDDWSPRFSPDGSRLVFASYRDGGGIHVVNALGGGQRRVAGRGLFPQFSPDGAGIVYVEDPLWSPTWLRPMKRFPVAGGEAEPFLDGWGVMSPPASVGPVFSPDGRRVLFFGARLEEPQARDWWVAPLEGGEPWSSGALEDPAGGGLAGMYEDGNAFPVAWVEDRLLVVAGNTLQGMNLYSTGISDVGRISGPVVPLTSGPGMTWSPTVSRAGRLALSRFSWMVHLWEVALDPDTGGARGSPRRLTDDLSPKFSFHLSGDGSRLVYSATSASSESPRTDLLVADRTSGERTTPAAFDLNIMNLVPILSGDGSLVVWHTGAGREVIAWLARVDNPVARELCRGCEVLGFFPDGGQVLVDRGSHLARMRISDAQETVVLEHERTRPVLNADLSSDGGWLALRVGEPDGRLAIHAVPIGGSPSPADWTMIEGGAAWVGCPRWSTDGNLLYYLSERDGFSCVWAQPVEPQTKAPRGDPFAVVHAHTSAMKMRHPHREVWKLDVAADRLVFNAAEMTGDIYTAMLPAE